MRSLPAASRVSDSSIKEALICLRASNLNHRPSNTRAAGGCGAPNKLLQLLERPPRAAAVQLAWEAAAPSGAEVRATLEAAGEELDLSQLYIGLHPGASSYRLGAMLCCQPSEQTGASSGECHALLLDTASGQWLASAPRDDGKVTVVGTWAALLQKIETERIHPSLLFYLHGRDSLCL